MRRNFLTFVDLTVTSVTWSFGLPSSLLGMSAGFSRLPEALCKHAVRPPSNSMSCDSGIKGVHCDTLAISALTPFPLMTWAR